MEEHIARRVGERLTAAFTEKSFLRKLGANQAEVRQLLALVDWTTALRPVFPLSGRLSCGQVLELCRPMLDGAAPEPPEGWLALAYHVAETLLFPSADHTHTSRQWDGALCYLRVLQVLLDEERAELPFDPQYDFAFCTEEVGLRATLVAEGLPAIPAALPEEHIYELLRLGREITPFHNDCSISAGVALRGHDVCPGPFPRAAGWWTWR